MKKTSCYTKVGVLLLLLITAGAPAPAPAATITNVFDVDIQPGMIFDRVDPAGNTGKILKLTIFPFPFTYSAGDTIVTQINFLTPLEIRDTANDFWGSFGGGNPNQEPLGVVYWWIPSYDAFNSIDYTATFDVLQGSANTVSGNVTSACCQGVSMTGGSGVENFVDDYAVVSGLTVIADSVVADLGGPLYQVTIDFQAGDISVIPIPTAVWLFGSALGLLGWMKRKATSHERPHSPHGCPS